MNIDLFVSVLAYEVQILYMGVVSPEAAVVRNRHLVPLMYLLFDLKITNTLNLCYQYLLLSYILAEIMWYHDSQKALKSIKHYRS